jgi:hypothetical protein
VEAQHGGKIKQFFRQSEMRRLLKECKAGLELAEEVFKVITISSSLIGKEHVTGL